MVPTCSGDVKRAMVDFLDRFRGEGAGADGGVAAAGEPQAAAL